MPTHVIKSRVGKLKTKLGKLQKFLVLCPLWPETVPSSLIHCIWCPTKSCL